MIRIIGGIYKGKRLKKVPGSRVRPMPHKLRETMFNIIQDDIKSSVFLDGFAGTGSVGIEALSRGAERVIFIDDYNPSVKVIKSNLAKCEAEEKARVIRGEFNRVVIQLAKENVKFDLVFLDPPYRLLDERNPLKVIKKREILEPEGLIILRHHFKTRFDAKYYQLQRQTTIGDDTLSFYS
ncbi:MAG: 16S rRNA (guanine(966)-N(2))-methyltransferase RsmD [Candidatus Aminicenantes bacterium]|nr:MAG: 16S rRNA (guanine(966)-N(2))-methyltransferase RsmD [Candidatus Aminicenantes bacterium]